MIALLADSGIDSIPPAPLWVKVVVSVVVLGLGAVVGLGYLGRPLPGADADPSSSCAGRPWRRVGAAICVVVSVMFVLGICLLDGKPPPRVFLAYWILVLALVLWLCGLAFKDLWHTRRLFTSRPGAYRRTDSIADPRRGEAQSEDPS